MKIIKIVLINLFILIGMTVAEEDGKASNFGFGNTTIETKFKEIKDTSAQEYALGLLEVKNYFSEYYTDKREQCSGEYKFLEKNEAGESSEVSKKLTKDERQLCLYELKKNQIYYIQTLIFAEKKLAKLKLQKKLSSLDTLQAKMLKDLELSFQKKKRRRKRSRRKNKRK